MSKLTQILCSAVDSVSQDNAFTVINSAKVYDVIPSTTNPYSCNLLYKRLGGSTKQTFTAASAPSAVRALLNAANTTDVKVIPITEINQDNTTQSRSVNIKDINKIIVDPLDSGKSYVFVENQVLTGITALHASNTMASLLSAGNA